jgi:hypothetical protein
VPSVDGKGGKRRAGRIVCQGEFFRLQYEFSRSSVGFIGQPRGTIMAIPDSLERAWDKPNILSPEIGQIWRGNYSGNEFEVISLDRDKVMIARIVNGMCRSLTPFQLAYNYTCIKV